MNHELAKTVAIKSKIGESMQHIAESLGITYGEVESAVKEVMNSIEARAFCQTFHAGYPAPIF